MRTSPRETSAGAGRSSSVNTVDTEAVVKDSSGGCTGKYRRICCITYRFGTNISSDTYDQHGAAKPFRHKLRAILFARFQYLEQKVVQFLDMEAISKADTGACLDASRTVTTPKMDGSFRMCVDYRDINAQTEKDSYLLPHIDQVWPVLAMVWIFASFELLRGNHQVKVEPKDRFKTACVTQEVCTSIMSWLLVFAMRLRPFSV